jgi:hypothetical protein
VSRHPSLSLSPSLFLTKKIKCCEYNTCISVANILMKNKSLFIQTIHLNGPEIRISASNAYPHQYNIHMTVPQNGTAGFEKC